MNTRARDRAVDQFNRMRARPGMHLPGASEYAQVAAFVCGMDLAYDGALLQGFNDWVQTKYGKRSPIYWGSYLNDVFEGLPNSERAKFGDATQFLLAELDEFLKQAS